MNKKNGSVKKLFFKIAKKSLIIGCIIPIQQSYSQDTIQNKNIEGVVITSSRSEQNINEVGRSISVISSEEIQNSVYTNVSELLSKKEGIYIVGNGQTPGSLQSLFLRGANSEHTMILIDGVRINNPSSTDNAINLAELSLANIERIEIVRGSHSTLYGSSAIGGVINIITKKGQKPGFKGGTEVISGTFGKSTLELSENVNLNYTTKSGFYVRGELFNTHVNGLDATVDTVTNQNAYKNRDKDGFDKMDLIGKTGFKNNKWDIFASYKNTKQLSDIDAGSYTDDDNYTIRFGRNLLSYQTAYKFNSKLNITFSGGFSDMNTIALNDSSIVDKIGNYDHSYSKSTYKASVLNNELLLNYKTKNLSLVIGGGNYQETMTSQSRYVNTAWAYKSESNLDSLNIKAITNNTFVHLDVNGGLFSDKLKQLNLALGVRFNEHSTYGKYLTYEINPSYKINKNSMLYGTFSTGFNSPALYRMYAPNADPVSKVTRGNISLNPETSISYEIGLKQQVTETTSFTLSIFQTEVSNLIEYVYLWDKAIGIDTLGNDWMRNDFRGDTYINIGKQINHGFEFGISSKLSEKLTFNGNISMVSGKLVYQPGNSAYTENYHVQLFATGDFLTKEIEKLGLVRRSNTANFNLTYQPIKKLMITTDVRYVGSRSDVFYNSALGPYGALGQTAVKDYTLVGISAKYKIVKTFFVTININNLFNTKYQEISGYTTRGRGFYLKLNYSF
ncbi:MAG: TonB-dependent receptor [Flavobacteriia bacterium]|nr:TonB-dependent receptor [Flavobacteriia bacterium]